MTSFRPKSPHKPLHKTMVSCGRANTPSKPVGLRTKSSQGKLVSYRMSHQTISILRGTCISCFLATWCRISDSRSHFDLRCAFFDSFHLFLLHRLILWNCYSSSRRDYDNDVALLLPLPLPYSATTDTCVRAAHLCCYENYSRRCSSSNNEHSTKNYCIE